MMLSGRLSLINHGWQESLHRILCNISWLCLICWQWKETCHFKNLYNYMVIARIGSQL